MNCIRCQNYSAFVKANVIKKPIKSIKLKNIETLNIYGGRNVELSKLTEQVDCSNLKQLILHKCVGRDRTFPNLPNLETLVIDEKYQSNAKIYNKFSNLKNLKYLEKK